MIYLGIDACPKGWVAISITDGGVSEGVVVNELDELADVFSDAAAIAIDIPLGIPERDPRAADLAAKESLGPRQNSVFLTPIRAALDATSYSQANEISRKVTGKGMSRQSYALAPKILEAERWSGNAPAPVWEVHPEVSFTVLTGAPCAASKKTWLGMQERLAALQGAELDPGSLGEDGRHAAVDDVLDATVAAWSARRIAHGEGISLPDPPEVDPVTGQPIAIWV